MAVLGVPCNQFGHQEPGANATEIYNILRYVRPGRGFVPSFKLTEKIDVNGPKQHALFKHLKATCATGAHNDLGNPKELFWTPLRTDDIRWNFEKFVISKSGVPLFRAEPAVNPDTPEFDQVIRSALLEN